MFDTILNPKAIKNKEIPSDSDLTAEAVEKGWFRGVRSVVFLRAEKGRKFTNANSACREDE